MRGDGVEQRTIAGDVNSTEIAEPTSVALGRTRGDRERRRLYVTTAGALAVPVDGEEILGGQLVAVDMKGKKRDGRI